MSSPRLLAAFIILLGCSSCTNAKSNWVKKCNEQQKIMKAQLANISGSFGGLSVTDGQSEAWAQLDCKSFAEKQNPACEKNVAELSGAIKTGIYENCMQTAVTTEVAASYMSKMNFQDPANPAVAATKHSTSATDEERKAWNAFMGTLDTLNAVLGKPGFDINSPEFTKVAPELKSAGQKMLDALPSAFEGKRKNIEALIFSIANRDKAEILKQINEFKTETKTTANEQK